MTGLREEGLRLSQEQEFSSLRPSAGFQLRDINTGGQLVSVFSPPVPQKFVGTLRARSAGEYGHSLTRKIENRELHIVRLRQIETDGGATFEWIGMVGKKGESVDSDPGPDATPGNTGDRWLSAPQIWAIAA